MTTKMGHYVIPLARKLDQVQSVLTLCYFCQTLLMKKKKRNNTKTLLSGSKLCLIHVVLIQTKSRTVLRYIHETALKCRSKRIVQYSVSPPICGGLSESRSVTWNVMLPQQGCLGGTVPCEEKEAVWPKHRQGVCDMKNTRSTTMFSMSVTGCGGWGVKCLQSVIKSWTHPLRCPNKPYLKLTSYCKHWGLTLHHHMGFFHCRAESNHAKPICFSILSFTAPTTTQAAAMFCHCGQRATSPHLPLKQMWAALARLCRTFFTVSVCSALVLL